MRFPDWREKRTERERMAVRMCFVYRFLRVRQSPAYDPKWAENGHLDNAANLLAYAFVASIRTISSL